MAIFGHLMVFASVSFFDLTANKRITAIHHTRTAFYQFTRNKIAHYINRLAVRLSVHSTVCSFARPYVQNPMTLTVLSFGRALLSDSSSVSEKEEKKSLRSVRSC